MKSLIERIFRQDTTLNYVIAEYKPNHNLTAKQRAKMTEYEDDLLDDKDEMAIDNLYQRN